jgi:hypothetical protein
MIFTETRLRGAYLLDLERREDNRVYMTYGEAVNADEVSAGRKPIEQRV